MSNRHRSTHKGFVPLIDRVHTRGEKVAVVIAMIVTMILVGAFIDRVYARPVSEQFKPSLAASNPMVTMTMWRKNSTGKYVARQVRGHANCKPGALLFLVDGKRRCVPHLGPAVAPVSPARKAIIKCGAQTFVGWWYAGPPGIGAGVAGCVIEWTL